MTTDEIRSVRDRVIEEWNAIVDGRLQGRRPDDVRSVIWRWDDRHLIHLRWLIAQIVDSTLERLRER